MLPTLMNNPHPLISVITPAYNCGSKIEETILSVLSQQTGLFETIIVDGLSKDDTIEVVKRYEDRVRWVSRKDKNCYDAMNTGIEMSTGRFLFFLGAGDCLRQDSLASIAPILLQAEEAAKAGERLPLVYGNVYWVSREIVYDGPFDRFKIARTNLPHQAAFYDRRLYDMFGKFDLKYRITADWVLNIRFFADPRVSIQYVDQTVANYEGEGMSDTQQDAFMADQPGIIRRYLGLRPYIAWRVGIEAERAWLRELIIHPPKTPGAWLRMIAQAPGKLFPLARLLFAGAFRLVRRRLGGKSAA